MSRPPAFGKTAAWMRTAAFAHFIKDALLVRSEDSPDGLAHLAHFLAHFRADLFVKTLNPLLAVRYDLGDLLLLRRRQVQVPDQAPDIIFSCFPGKKRPSSWAFPGSGNWVRPEFAQDRAPREEACREDDQDGQDDFPGAHQVSLNSSTAAKTAVSKVTGPPPLTVKKDQKLSIMEINRQTAAARHSAWPHQAAKSTGTRPAK